jgi:succinyl-CoA synthetase beta subunit
VARLFEYQGKKLLSDNKIGVPRGHLCTSSDQVHLAVSSLGGKAVVKAQVWSTKRAAWGGIKVVASPDEGRKVAETLFGKKVGQFTVEKLLVEEALEIKREFYAGVIVDDSQKAPVMIFSSRGGTGIEEIAQQHPESVARRTIDLDTGLFPFQARDLALATGLERELLNPVADVLVNLYRTARRAEARSAEINPLVLTRDGRVMAADCRIAVDDYAVFRHPELDIEIARELDRPPTLLDRIAYDVEKNDYRGTFYFIQMEEGFKKGERYVGFHGAGGGGSMMSMDALLQHGFKVANFTDTSGNPPASKVYRAARIILSQAGLDGYFGSGSGVASQEQFHSARGLVKAFREVPLPVPAVIRLGGNAEEKAISILTEYTRDLGVPVEGYGKDDTPDHCASRLEELVNNFKPMAAQKVEWSRPEAKRPYVFQSPTGTIQFDHDLCSRCENKVCITECVPQILKADEHGLPVLNITPEEARKGKCTECLACEVECFFHGNRGGHISLPIAGLDQVG